MTATNWAAVPLRALADPDMTLSRLKVLAVVGYFARFGKNGTGCYASHARIARECATHRVTVSNALYWLVENGYLRTRPSLSGKRTQYLVVYDESETVAPGLQNGGSIGGAPANAPSVTRSAETTNLAQCVASGTTQIYSPKGYLRDSPKGASLRPEATPSFFENELGRAIRLRRIAQSRPLTDAELEESESLVDMADDNAVTGVLEEAWFAHECHFEDFEP